MSAWMTAAEIAAAKLPDFPRTERAIQLMAKRLGWDQHPAYVRSRTGRGGGYEYNIQILPTLAQMALLQRNMVVGVPALAEQTSGEQEVSPNLSDRAARERDARLAIIAEFDRMAAGLPRLRHCSHLQLFMDKYNGRTLHIESWVTDLIPSISKRSIDRWRAAKKAGTSTKLAVDRSQARKGTGVLDLANDGQVRTLILALLAQNAHYSAAHIRDQVESVVGAEVWVPYKGAGVGMTKSVPLPPVRTFQHFIAALKADQKVVLTKLTDPDKYRSTMLPAGVGSLRHISQPNMLWQIDASPVDALCTDGRHSIYACVEIFSRRTILLVSKTPRASAVALLMRKAIMAWGVPLMIKTDNGSDFVARDTKRLFLSLGIEPDVSDAYSPQQKGHIERFIKTFQHDCATLLPGFVGHSVADRKAIENRKSFSQRLGQTEAETFDVKLSGIDLQRIVDRWVETMYEQREHHGIQGLTPVQKWNSANYRPRFVDPRALDLLLMPVAGKDGIRTTTKFGLRINGYHYATPHILPGVTVLVRQDPEDLGHVLAFEADGGRYVGEGTCPELAGVHPASFMKAVRQVHAEAIAEIANPVRKMMRELAKGPAPIERALQLAADRPRDNVVSLPELAEAHTTRQIDAALAAMDTMAGRVPTIELDDATAIEHRKLIAAFEAEEAEERANFGVGLEVAQAGYEAQRAADLQAELPDNVETIDTPKSRYLRAVKTDRAIEAGDAVAPFEALWLGQYKTTDEYRGHKAVHDEFGDSYLT
ncbi:DDE-type integrase/transposase/recombinase [Devosia sp.]|uniref:DDE-type integrase/transposase/recombinase n=1 Tax=Devosia sp. TaxID=1871048 RepID=UPI001ACEE011|nr:DDE-type integrase/transposase/recombinase [Devosia sp.]MBN9333266.1 DDE-type integrase/transposase/recombinase [Devosia sp.]